MKTQIGGDRLGSGNKNEVSLRNYERSTHDLGYIWRSSMSSGTLVPFMSEVALPGDSFDIDLDCDVKTLPTVGPLFGSYKVQLDVFECPIRLYNGKLHMNMLNIGMDMSQILLPQLEMKAYYDKDSKADNSQINSSSIYSYLNIRGLGRSKNGDSGTIKRQFNAVPYLGYWDIYKNYYANKQEERGYVIHSKELDNDLVVTDVQLNTINNVGERIGNYDIHPTEATGVNTQIGSGATGVESVNMVVFCEYASEPTSYGLPDVNNVKVRIDGVFYDATEVFDDARITEQADGVSFIINYDLYNGARGIQDWLVAQNNILNTDESGQGEPQLTQFVLDNIDDMRMDILESVRQVTPFVIDENTLDPYGLGLGEDGDVTKSYKLASQEGLGIKTYQSDLFNNWISTEWIDGSNGINEVTAVDTSSGDFTIDALNLANKVYNMLNRIAISGGSYDDWLDAVYTHERAKSTENPVYHGSLIKELAFEEVVSQADVTDQDGDQQPLGTLAGRGRLTGKNKGGKIKIKVNEPSYIIGIVSLTPRIDYSQGNKWDVNLKNMNDFHKPALDEIGYQDLVTDQLAWFDTKTNFQGEVEYRSAGKQPAWINYMTNVSQTRGSFAEKTNDGQGDSMFMTLNRQYERDENGIADLTTYVDPSKYNNIFAVKTLDSQNFWVQISNKITARRKMSAKVIPNL